MAYTPGNQPGSGKSKIIDNRVKKGSGDRKATQTSQSLAGTYKTQEIDGKKYTSFVPDNVQITSKESVVSGGKPSSNIARQLANVPSQVSKTVTVEGRRTTAPVPVSQGVYGRLSGEQLAKPEPNTQYFAQLTQSSRQNDKKYIPVQPSRGANDETAEAQLAQNFLRGSSSSSSNGNIPNERSSSSDSLLVFSNSGISPSSKKTLFEKQIDFADKWQQAAEKRSQSLISFSENFIRESPIRRKILEKKGYFTNETGTNLPELSYWEKIGAKGLAAPAQITLGLGDAVGLIGFKTSLIAQGRLSFNPNIRASTKAETDRARSLTPPITTLFKNSFNPKTPEGFVSIALTAAAPSFINKGVQSVKGVGFIGKTEIPVGTITEPQILTGKQTFPSSSKTSPALLDEFQNTPFQKPIKDILGKETQGGFSASPSALKLKGGVQAGTSETPGLYIAPSLSKYFLKLNGEEGYKFSIFPQVRTPSINYIETEVGLIPKNFIQLAEARSGSKIGIGGQQSNPKVGNYNTAMKELNKYFEKDLAGSGKSAISPQFYLGKGEKEALVSVGSSLTTKKPGYNLWDKATGFKYYSTVDGQRVPIRIIQTGKTSSPIGNIQTKILARSIRESTYARPTSVPLSGILGSSSARMLGSSRQATTSSRLSSLAPSRPSKTRIFDSRGSTTPDIIRPTSRTPDRNTPALSITTPPSKTSRPGQQSKTSYPIISTTNKTPYIPIVPLNTAPPSPPRRSIITGSKDKGKLFSVEVKRFGKFTTVGRGLSQEKALNLGKGIVQGSAARTFRLKRGGVPVNVGALGGFYTRPGGLNIEQVQYAINTGGELRDISFKGWQTPRAKKKGRLSIF